MNQKDKKSFQTIVVAVLVALVVLWLATSFISFLLTHWFILAIAIVVVGCGFYFLQS